MVWDGRAEVEGAGAEAETVGDGLVRGLTDHGGRPNWVCVEGGVDEAELTPAVAFPDERKADIVEVAGAVRERDGYGGTWTEDGMVVIGFGFGFGFGFMFMFILMLMLVSMPLCCIPIPVAPNMSLVIDMLLLLLLFFIPPPNDVILAYGLDM